MASIYDNAMTIVPGYSDPGTPDPDTLELRSSAAAGSSSVQATLKVTWVMVVGALAALWIMGKVFK